MAFKGKISKQTITWIIALAAAVSVLCATLLMTGYMQKAFNTVISVFAPAESEPEKEEEKLSSKSVAEVPSEGTNTAEISENQSGSDAENTDSVFTRPDKIRGTWLVPGKDFLTGNPDYNTALTQWTKQLETFNTYMFNTVLLPVNSGEKLLYKSAGDKYLYPDSDNDLLAEMLKKAHDFGIYVFCAMPVPEGDYTTVKSAAVKQAEKLSKYKTDGLFLQDYHRSVSDSVYENYHKYGGGMGIDDFLRSEMTGIVRFVEKAVHKNNSKIYFGIIANSVWATKSEKETGVDGKSSFSAYTNGHADTAGWMSEGIIDTAIVQIDKSTKDSSLTFNTAAKWWSELAKSSGAEVVVCHSSDKIANGAFLYDELVKQAMAVDELTITGSLYNSYSSIKSDKTQSTENLIAYYAGKIDKNDIMTYIMKDLSFSSPSKTTFTTHDSKLNIRGASDPLFDLTMNGTKLKQSDLGFFSEDLTLKPGLNKYTFSHKGKTVTYNITYKLIIVKDIFPAANQTMNSGMSLNVSVVALRDSKVTAKLNGTTITLTQQNQPSDEGGGDAYSTFVDYVGIFKLPATFNKDQNLGAVTFSATHSGQTETKTGGKITVKASSAYSGPNGGNYHKVSGEFAAEVVISSAETFKGDTNDDYSNPMNSYLPKGTVDYIDNTIITFKTPGGEIREYRRWRYNKRTYVTHPETGANIKIYTGGSLKLPETNTITIADLKADTRHTYMTLETLWKAPFQLEFENAGEYKDPNPSDGTRPDYTVKSSFNARYLDITFNYCALGQGTLDFTNNPVFSKAEWFKNEFDYTLRLHFKKAGGFYGWSASYNSSNQLVFSFLHPARLGAAATPLSNTKILIDPGHGGVDPGATGANSNYHEKVLNLKISNILKDKLTAMGAKVEMTRTTDKKLTLLQRASITREIKPDLFVSVHMNSSTSGSARGYELYYFTPFSFKYSSIIHKNASKIFSADRGNKYGAYFVARTTECPAVLTENGFISNSQDYTAMLTGDWAAKTGAATAQGILEYFQSIQ